MSPSTMLFRSVVTPFYRENAGTFIFFLTLMLFAVGHLNGAGPVKYHLALILGMLDNYFFLLLVMFCWYLYVRKVKGFVLQRIRRPDYEFLSILNTISNQRRIGLLLSMQLLLLPIISLYGLLIIKVAVKHQYFVEAGIVLGFLLFFHIRPAMVYSSVISGETKYAGFINRLISRISWLNTTYTGIHLQFMTRKLPGPLVAIKCFTCGLLYLAARNNLPPDYEVQLLFLFFITGVVAHSILIIQMTEFSYVRLEQMRAGPISLVRRWMRTALLLLIQLVPELLTIVFLLPVRLHPADGLSFYLAAVSSLTFIASIAGIQHFNKRQFLSISFLILTGWFIATMTGTIDIVSVVLLSASLIFYLKYGYNYEYTSE
jgi:hypothetical protein